MKKGDVEFGPEELSFLSRRCGVPDEEGGVRGIKQSLESVILHVNQLRITQDVAGDGVNAESGDQKADGGDQKAEKADGGEKKVEDGEMKELSKDVDVKGDEKKVADGENVDDGE